MGDPMRSKERSSSEGDPTDVKHPASQQVVRGATYQWMTRLRIPSSRNKNPAMRSTDAAITMPLYDAAVGSARVTTARVVYVPMRTAR